MSELIEQHIQARKLDNVSEKNLNRLRGRLKMCEPFGEDYEALERHLEGLKKSKDNETDPRYSPKTIKEIIREYKKYIAWKKETPTSMEPTTQTELTTYPAPVEVKDEQPRMSDDRPKTGRKRIDPSGEPRSVKLGTYVTPSLYEDVQDLARLHRKNTSDFINELLYREVTKYTDKLTKLKELAVQD